jgi:hypothetical protein
MSKMFWKKKSCGGGKGARTASEKLYRDNFSYIIRRKEKRQKETKETMHEPEE